jgi:hypothetical protein
MVKIRIQKKGKKTEGYNVFRSKKVKARIKTDKWAEHVTQEKKQIKYNPNNKKIRMKKRVFERKGDV